MANNPEIKGRPNPIEKPPQNKKLSPAATKFLGKTAVKGDGKK